MADTGTIEIEPSYQFTPGESADNEKFNQGFSPIGRAAPKSIGERELIDEDTANMANSAGALRGRELVADRNDADVADIKPFIYRSADFSSGRFDDGLVTVGSTVLTSAKAAFTTDDNGRVIAGRGIPAGSTAAYSNATTINLSAPFLIEYSDGAITGGTALQSPTAQFTAGDTGRTIIGDGIPAGTTLTFVDATHATLSQAATNATGVVFHINGRQSTITFDLVGRGRGWEFTVGADGLGSLFAYRGALSAVIATGSFVLNEDGSISLGTGSTKLTATAAGDFVWGNPPDSVTIDRLGRLFAGATAFEDALAKIDQHGNLSLLDVATALHSIATGALNPAIEDVIASPAGGAIVNPTSVSLNCLTKYTRIYYRLVGHDLNTTSGAKTATSATGNFKPTDVGKTFTCDNFPAGTYIEKWNSATSIDLSANATANATTAVYVITPNTTDTLYIDGTPIILTASRHLSARAYKNGEYSALGAWGFDTAAGATTVQNPTLNPVPGSYSGSSRTVTLSCATAAASLFYTKTTDGTTPATPTHDGSLNPTGATVKVVNGTVLTFGVGTTKIKVLAAKAGLTDSGVILGTYVVTKATSTGGGGDGTGGGGGHSLL